MLSSFRSIIYICQVVADGRLKNTKENFKLLALEVVAVAYAHHFKEYLTIRISL